MPECHRPRLATLLKKFVRCFYVNFAEFLITTPGDYFHPKKHLPVNCFHCLVWAYFCLLGTWKNFFLLGTNQVKLTWAVFLSRSTLFLLLLLLFLLLLLLLLLILLLLLLLLLLLSLLLYSILAKTVSNSFKHSTSSRPIQTKKSANEIEAFTQSYHQNSSQQLPKEWLHRRWFFVNFFEIFKSRYLKTPVMAVFKIKKSSWGILQDISEQFTNRVFCQNCSLYLCHCNQ